MTYKNEPSWGEALGKLFLVIFGGAALFGIFAFAVGLLMLLKAFVFVQLWNWFVIPVFPTAPVLTYVQAIGLSLVITFYLATRQWQQYQEYKNEKDSGLVFFKFLWNGSVNVLLAWFIGWVVTWFL